MAAISTIAAIATAAAAVGGAAQANRNARRAQQQAGQAAEEGAAAADPGAVLRPDFQNLLMGLWPSLSGVNSAQILQDPSFKFQQQMGMQGIENAASANGLLRSGTLLEDMAKFNQGLASTYVDKQFGRNMEMLKLLGAFSGLTTGSPGAAGQILGQGGMNNAVNGYNWNNNTMGQIGGAITQIGNLYAPGGPLYSGTNPPTGGGVSMGGP